MATGAEAVKKTAEQASAAGAQAFREGVEKSLNALTELNAQGKRNLEALVESVSAATRGAEALGAQSLAYSKKSWEDGVTAAQALASAKSMQEVVELQTGFANSAIETYLGEVTRMTEPLTNAVRDSFKPLNERMTATLEKVQSAR